MTPKEKADQIAGKFADAGVREFNRAALVFIELMEEGDDADVYFQTDTDYWKEVKKAHLE